MRKYFVYCQTLERKFVDEYVFYDIKVKRYKGEESTGWKKVIEATGVENLKKALRSFCNANYYKKATSDDFVTEWNYIIPFIPADDPKRFEKRLANRYKFIIVSETGMICDYNVLLGIKERNHKSSFRNGPISGVHKDVEKAYRTPRKSLKTVYISDGDELDDYFVSGKRLKSNIPDWKLRSKYKANKSNSWKNTKRKHQARGYHGSRNRVYDIELIPDEELIKEFESNLAA